MQIELNIDGNTAFKGEISPWFLDLIRAAPKPIPTVSRFTSTPITVPEAEELLSAIDPKSRAFLKRFPATDGQLTWREVREIFDIDDRNDWSAYASFYGRGITRALRRILKDSNARLIWWHEHDPIWVAENKDAGMLFVDGPALDALREAEVPE